MTNTCVSLSLLMQPEEEINKFTIAEDLSEMERIKLLLEKRDPQQFGYVFLNAVNIFRGDAEMQAEIIPLLIDKTRGYSEDYQVLAGDAFAELIDQKVRALSDLLIGWIMKIADLLAKYQT